MTMMISAAAYTNPSREGAVITTAEAGAVLITPSDAALWAQMLAFGPAEFEMPTPPVPASVTMRQAERALRAAGKLQAVETAIAEMPGDAGEDARIDWRRASTVERASPLVAAMGVVLLMNDAALDELFRQAAAL